MTDRTHRTRNLGIAGALALLAALLTMLYGSRAQGKTTVVAPKEAPVLVATKDLPIGTSLPGALASGAVAVRRVPAETLALGAVESAAQLRGTVVVQPIFAHEQLTLRRLGTSGEQGIRTVLKGALRAIAVPGDARQLLAGTLEQGDHVDVVVNDRTSQPPKTRVALRNLIVLEPPAAEASGSDGTTQATLQLTDRQVQVLWWAVKNGDWSLVLRPASKAVVTATAPTRERDVLAGS
jgi:Flp pilus assembly protein CpaB